MADFGPTALRVDTNTKIVFNSEHIIYFEIDDDAGINTIYLTNGQRIRVWHKHKETEVLSGEV